MSQVLSRLTLFWLLASAPICIGFASCDSTEEPAQQLQQDSSSSAEPKKIHDFWVRQQVLALNPQQLWNFGPVSKIEGELLWISRRHWLKPGDLISLEDAEDYFSQQIRLADKSAHLYERRGLARRATGNFDGALDDFAKALTLDSKSAIIFYNRGITWNELGEYDKAISDFSRAIALDPGRAVLFHNRSLSRCEKGDLDQALEDCNSALRLDPQLVPAYLQLAILFNKRGELYTAIEVVEKLISVDPEWSQAYSFRGELWERLRNPHKAIEDYQRAIQLNPLAVIDSKLNFDDSRDVIRAISDGDDKFLESAPMWKIERLGGNGECPIHFAAKTDAKWACEILLRRGVRADIPTTMGFQPLHLACLHGSQKVTELLCANRALANKTVNGRLNNWTPLALACASRNTHLIKTLLSAGADESALLNNLSELPAEFELSNLHERRKAIEFLIDGIRCPVDSRISNLAGFDSSDRETFNVANHLLWGNANVRDAQVRRLRRNIERGSPMNERDVGAAVFATVYSGDAGTLRKVLEIGKDYDVNISSSQLFREACAGTAPFDVFALLLSDYEGDAEEWRASFTEFSSLCAQDKVPIINHPAFASIIRRAVEYAVFQETANLAREWCVAQGLNFNDMSREQFGEYLAEKELEREEFVEILKASSIAFEAAGVMDGGGDLRDRQRTANRLLNEHINRTTPLPQKSTLLESKRQRRKLLDAKFEARRLKLSARLFWIVKNINHPGYLLSRVDGDLYSQAIVNSSVAIPYCASANGDRVAGIVGSNVFVWNVSSGDKVVWFRHTGKVSAIGLSPNGDFLITSEADSARLFDLRDSAKPEVTIPGFRGSIRALTFSGNGKLVLIASGDVVQIHEPYSAECERPKQVLFGEYLGNLDHPIRQIACSFDGSRIATSEGHTNITVWDVEKGVRCAKCTAGAGLGYYLPSVGIRLSFDGGRLFAAAEGEVLQWNLTATYDNSREVWTTRNDEPKSIASFPTVAGRSVDFDLDGNKLLVAFADGFQQWRVGEDSPDARINTDKRRVEYCGYMTSGKKLYAIYFESKQETKSFVPKIVVYDARTKDELASKMIE